MGLTEQEVLLIEQARDRRRKPEFIKQYKEKMEALHASNQKDAERREPSVERLREVFNF